jgi:ABC-type Fe3+/spermidine/putrescine transport system ATPase subunit
VSSPGREHVPPERRRIGMVFQDYALFPHLDVGANVAFGIHHLAAGRTRAAGRRGAGAGRPGRRERRFAHELSGGQQQRVALARALAPAPRLLLLDEPFSNLDVDLRERLAHEVRAILKAAGATALFVTHDQLEAFADRRRDRRDAGRPPAPVGRRLHALPPAGHAFCRRLHRPRRVHAGHHPQQWTARWSCRPRWAN